MTRQDIHSTRRRIGAARAALLVLAWASMGANAMGQAQAPLSSVPTSIVSLNGGSWLLATDPRNVGRQERWFERARPEAKPTHVPWIIQDAFPGYHGVAWYWRTFDAPGNPHASGRYLLRFWQVDYAAEVWVNGKPAGRHEGGESPFTLDVTDAIQPAARNTLAVRVLNPTNEPIDGIVLAETAHRNKALPYGPGSAWDQGGIMDDVELLVTPPVRVADVFVRPDWRTGTVHVQATVTNAGLPARGRVEVSIAPGAQGATVAAATVALALPTGDTAAEADLRVPDHRLWELKEPVLYRLTARVSVDGNASFDECSTRFGFRDFRVENGAFRLNGKRVFVRSSHTGNCTPIGLEMPHDPDYLRRDLINAKFMGFNMIRFISGVPKRYQVDLCDEIGLMVYEESYAGWCMAYSDKFAVRYDESVLGMVRRDRNHPSVVIWGLLNETRDGPVFRHAVDVLPAVRALDDTRLVILGSGRWNILDTAGGIAVRRTAGRVDPCVTLNTTKHNVNALGIVWHPGQLAMHPGRNGEYADIRWTAPSAQEVSVAAVFRSIAEHATTDVHVLHNGKPLFGGGINVGGAGPEQSYHGKLAVQKGDTVDFVCGWGNGDYGADTTAADIVVTDAAGASARPTAGLMDVNAAGGPWSWGQLAPGAAPDIRTFVPFPVLRVEQQVGNVANPGSTEWQDILDDFHPYQRVPHTPDIVHTLRTVSGSALPTGFAVGGADPERFYIAVRDPDDRTPVFVSEYGIGSAVDLMRVCRLYEQAGKPDVEDARLYRTYRDRFLADWERWKMADAFGRPEEFFAQSNARMAAQRALGINALRSNPRLVGYSLTGTLDQGMTAEGLWTTFRELKPGTADAMFDAFAPLRWCLFAEPVHVYRGTPVHIEAVLSNEDALAPGTYPVELLVTGPGQQRVFAATVDVIIPPSTPGKEPRYTLPVLARDVVIDGPAGRYRLTATFQRGAAAAGESIEFYVSERPSPPKPRLEVALFGDDPGLGAWLDRQGIGHRAFSAAAHSRQVIVASGKPPTPEAYRQVAKAVAQGSTVVFLTPSVLSDGRNPVRWIPLANKGAYQGLSSWLYHKDEWCKQHPFFEGLPAPGLMDYTYYRELIPDAAFVGLDAPQEVVAAANDASIGYSSGLLVAVYGLGAGRFVLNALNIRDNLDKHPAADRLLLNMLRSEAARCTGRPAALPVNWDEQIRAVGY